MSWHWPGGRLDLAPGRVLQVSLQGKDVLWTPAVADGWNVGGDRLWLAPERDWFWAGDNPDDLSQHQVPPEIDPGSGARSGWNPGTSPSPPTPSWSTGRPARPPRSTSDVRSTSSGPPRPVEYEVRTSLEIAAGPPQQEVGLWNILQVPTGGRLTVELAGPWAYRDYLRPFNANRFEVTDTTAETLLPGQFMSKIGVQPDVFAGRVRYARAGVTVERNVTVRPDRRYCDHPLRADPSGQGDALQVFEDDGHYGGYVEIEHHSPAARYGTAVVDVCRTVVTVAS
ncbi:hypothetical protein GCM10029964_034750 [Kibdelosporangium lantanae]